VHNAVWNLVDVAMYLFHFKNRKVLWRPLCNKFVIVPHLPICIVIAMNCSLSFPEAYVMVLYASFAFGIFLSFAITLTCIAYK